MSKKFIGWDCAYKSLAWSYITVDTQVYEKLHCMVPYLAQSISCAKASGDLTDVLRVLNDMLTATRFVCFISCGVVDCLNGKKISETDEISRTKSIWDFLQSKPELAVPNDCVPIIEHQPSKIGSKTNNKSSVVGHQLMFFYVERDTVLVNPTLKNKICVRTGLDFETVLAREIPKHKNMSDARYTARKLHSKENFLYFVNTFGYENILAGVKKKYLDDLADATMQILAYMVEQKMFT